MQICAIVITRNNATTIEDIVLRARNVLEPHVFVVDEQSDDDTVQRSQAAGADLLLSGSNQRPALLSALQQVHNGGFTHAIVFRADELGTFFPEQMSHLLDAAWNMPDGVFVATAGPGLHRTPLDLIASIACWRPMRHICSSFRLYSVKNTLALPCRETGDFFEAEMLVRAAWNNMYTRYIHVGEHWNKPIESRNHTVGFAFQLLVGMIARIPQLLWRKVLT